MDSTADIRADPPAYAATPGRAAHNSKAVPVPDTLSLRFDRGQWTDATEATLRRLWDMGYSTNAIGDRLGFTKNAIVGKAHRMDLPSRASPIIRDGREPKQQPRLAAPRVTLPVLASMARDLPPIAVPKVTGARPVVSRAIRVPPPVGLTQAGVKARPVPIERIHVIAARPAPRVMNARCQFPLWGDSQAPTHAYCDAPALLGASWCDACRGRVFVKVTHASATLPLAN